MADDTIDRYQIKEKIGAGGMGTVYRAWDREIERDVALKWLPAYFSADVTFTERFKREARVVARLEHPHIVPIYDVGESEGRPFIIMRLLSGGTLRDQTAKQGFDLAALVKSLEQIGDALASAHARQIIHRDIKPGNILFDENGSAFLSDFGIAKVLDSATQLTGSGFIGTPAYMSPEQFIGQTIDGRSDQYSLAIVVYESLTGDLPFKGNTAQMMYKHINAQPPEINLPEYPIPAGLNPVLQKALAKDPHDRYARITDFVTAAKIAVREDPVAAAAALPLVTAAILSTPQKPPTAPTQLDTPPEQKTDQLQQDYRDGLEAMSRSEWAVALAAFDRVIQIAPDYGNAAEFRLQAQTSLDQSLLAPPPSVAGTPAAGSDETSLDIPPAVILPLAAEGLRAEAFAADLDKTSVDLPNAEEMGSAQPAPGPQETSLDMPSAAIPLAAAGAAVGALPPDLAETSLDLPSAATLGPRVAAEPLPAAVQQKKESGGVPLWLMVGAALLLLLLCAGGVFAVSNYLGGTDEESPTVQGAAVPAVAAGKQETVVLPTATAEPEPTRTSLPQPTEEPAAAPPPVEDTAVPPTPTELPTKTPEPQFPIVRVSVASANLRRGPGTIYPTSGAVFRDETATVLAQNYDGSWYNVELQDGTRAWLAASVTELVNNVAMNNVPLAATIPPAPTLTPVPPTWTPLPLPTLPPAATPGDGGGNGGDGGGNGGDGGGNGGDGGGGGGYTPEAP